MKTIALALALAFLVTLPLFAAAPVVSEKLDHVEITLPAGHTAVWVTWWGSWFTGVARDSDNDGRIIVDYDDFGLTWIVADAQTGEWTISPEMTQQPLPPGTILPVTGGKYGLLVLPSKYMGGALWIRPNVGAWAPITANLLGFPSGDVSFLEPTTLFHWRGLTTTALPPAAGFQRGDILLVMGEDEALTGSVNAQLDAPPHPGVFGFDRTGNEFVEGANMYFDLIRTGGTSGTVTVRCCNFAGTAVAGLDGDTERGENDERASLRVTWDGLPVAFGSLTILDDDDFPPTVVALEVHAFEKTGTSSTASFNIHISQTAQVAGSLRYSTVDGTARAGLDYVAASGTVTFPPDTQSFTIPVEILGDGTSEPTEDFFLKIEGQPDWLSIPAQPIKANLYDDDSPTAPHRLRVSDATVVEGDDWREATFTISLSRPATQNINVAYVTRDGTATAGTDYEMKSGNFTFTPGQTTQDIKVRVAGDQDAELLEMFELLVTAGTPVEDGIGVCLIDDDEVIPPRRRTSRH